MALVASGASLQAEFIQCLGGPCGGLDNADIINGSDLFDDISGGMGNDVIFGNDGPEFIDGDEGSDILFGGNGSDVIEGSDGNDNLLAGPDDGMYSQYAFGGSDNDSFFAFASETSTCLFIEGFVDQDTVNLIGFGPYSAKQPFGQTGWVEGWILVVDPIAGGNVLILVHKDDDFGTETIHGLPSPNVTILDIDGLEALNCPGPAPQLSAL
jgi:Ca2+-binding RTX toxin-like protein